MENEDRDDKMSEPVMETKHDYIMFAVAWARSPLLAS